ncbi:MAG: hydrogenase expression/formation protein HypE [Acidimicrobiales bacterium]|nr:MAG: hydrogenase expression/formation protein HypE [Acidimicrobiales bacterium]
MSDGPDVAGWSCPLPLRGYDRIVMGHGGGGKLSSELIEHLFVPAFHGSGEVELHDAATFDVDGGRLAFSTDSYVVRPLFFAGGCIGDLAVNGTVNDVAMSGAQPVALSAGFILEEGLAMATLGAVVDAMARAASGAGVRIATGDTKVVDAGLADGMYVTTAGIGVVPEGVDIRPGRARPGDVVILSGPIGAHGIAVLSTREGLEFGTDLESDTAPLNGLVAAMLAAFRDVHVLRDPTRGGVTAALCEIAASAHVGVEYDERAVPVPPAVAAACSFLGLDAMAIANEGRLVAFVPPEGVDAVMGAMHAHRYGRDACVIGRVVDAHPGVVVAKTALGGRRVVDVPLGEQLPRIC